LPFYSNQCFIFIFIFLEILEIIYLLFIFVMWYHGWRFSQQRFSISKDNPTEDLALMAKRFGETGKTVNKN
jgi:hypothetical protein